MVSLHEISACGTVAYNSSLERGRQLHLAAILQGSYIYIKHFRINEAWRSASDDHHSGDRGRTDGRKSSVSGRKTDNDTGGTQWERHQCYVHFWYAANWRGNLNTAINYGMMLGDENTNIQLMYIPSSEENDTFNFFKDLQQTMIPDLYGQDPKVSNNV